MSDGKRKISGNSSKSSADKTKNTNRKKSSVTVKDENKSKEIAAIVLCGIGVFMLFSIFNKLISFSSTMSQPIFH